MDDEAFAYIKSVLREYLDGGKNTAFLFGSRATGEAQKYSDFDIGIEGKPLEAMTWFNITEEFENSNLPYIVEVVDFNKVSEEFRQEAKKKIIPIEL